MADPRRATLLLPALFLAAALARPAAPQSTPAPPQTVTVTVTDKKGNFVTGLKAEDFTVFDGKLRLPLASFSHEEGPATIGLLLDASASMYASSMYMESGQGVWGALADFISAAHPSNEYFVLAFNQSPQMLLEHSTDRAAVVGAVERLAAAESKGRTALYDALYLAVDKAARGRHRRRVLILVTDGGDNLSRYTMKDVRRALAESDVTLYAVNVAYEHHSDVSLAGQLLLEHLTGMTGGRVYTPNTVRMLKVAMTDLADELRYQYALSFVPAPTERKDGWHDLKIKVPDVRDRNNRKVKVVARFRPGFYEAARR